MLAGLSILVNKRSWEPRHVVRTSDAPLKLQGRAEAGRLRNWQEDINAIVMYCPPTPQDPGSRAAYAETLYCLAGWLRKTFQDIPKRSTPYIMTDLNNRVGVPKKCGGKLGRGTRPPTRKRWLASLLFRDLMQEEEMAVINTFQVGEATIASTALRKCWRGGTCVESW